MERKIILIVNKLNSEKIELEDKLEKLINDDGPIGSSSTEIIDILKKIVLIESAGGVLDSYLPNITEKD